MPDAEVQAASSPAAAAAPETPAPADNGIDTFPAKTAPKPEVEESAPPEEPTESDKDESGTASEAAKQERSEEGSKAERRIKQLTAQVHAMERRLQQAQNPPQQQSLMQPPQRPKLEEFEDIEKYNQALEKYDNDNRIFAIQQDRISREQESRKQAAEKQMQELRSEWDKKCQRISKSNPEFNTDQALQRVEPSPTMDGFFVDSDYGPEILNYFDENPEEADRVRDLTPYKAVRALVEIENKLSDQVKGIKAKPSAVRPPGLATGRSSAPASPKTAADVLYG